MEYEYFLDHVSSVENFEDRDRLMWQLVVKSRSRKCLPTAARRLRGECPALNSLESLDHQAPLTAS